MHIIIFVYVCSYMCESVFVCVFMCVGGGVHGHVDDLNLNYRREA